MHKTRSFKELLSNVEKKKLIPIYNDIWYTLNQAIVQELVEKNYIELPKFGFIKIIRYKKKFKIDEKGNLNLKINWIKTKQGWREGTLNKDKFIYHTRNWGIKIVWSRPRLKNSTVYVFKPSRSNGQMSNVGMLNQLWFYLSQQDTNYLKIPMIN